jgi:hypothetical protein
MNFQNGDLGLELLMNSKKKLPADSISIISSHSSARGGGSENIEHVDVRKHLVPPSDNDDDDDDDDDGEDDFEYEDEDGDGDDEEDLSESQDSGNQKKQGQHDSNQFKRQQPRISDEDIINEKKELLYQFERLEKKGVRLPRKFTLASNLEEMRMEYERISRDREIDTSVKFQKRMMMTAVSGLEFAADNFPALGAKLSGWSNSVNDELDEYEDIFVELHDKYKGKAKMSPELRLLGGLAGSAFMFHLTHKFSNSIPGLDTVLKQNPELAAKLAEATKNQMNQQQETTGNFFSGLGGLGGMFGNMFGGGGQTAPPPMPSNMSPQQPMRPRTPQSSVRMRGPSNVDDILSELNALNDNRVEMMSTISESDIGELADDISSINGLFVNKNGKTIDLDL